MSQSENLHEANRWLSTAYEDYDTAQYLLKGDKFSHSCFCCQQAGEKAMKAIWYYFDLEPWGHSILKLINEFPPENKIQFMDDIRKAARLLDKSYIPTRYPDSFPDMTPNEIYQREDSEGCLESAKNILSFAKNILNK